MFKPHTAEMLNNSNSCHNLCNSANGISRVLNNNVKEKPYNNTVSVNEMSTHEKYCLRPLDLRVYSIRYSYSEVFDLLRKQL